MPTRTSPSRNRTNKSSFVVAPRTSTALVLSRGAPDDKPSGNVPVALSPSLSELAALTAEGAPSVRGDTVLVTDASAEGETIASALRERGFHVVDLPIALLEGRIALERPRVVVVDVDEPGALAAVARLRERTGGIDLALIGVGDPVRGAEIVRGPVDHVFERPVDLRRLMDVIGNLASPVASMRGTTPPPSYAPRPTTPPLRESEHPPSGSGGLDAMLDDFGIADDGLGPLPIGAPVPLSPELDAILIAAEQKVAELDARTSSAPQSDEAPGDDGGLLPADLLAALDEPLGPGDDGAEGTGAADGTGTPTGWPRESGSVHGTSERDSLTGEARSRGERSRSGSEPGTPFEHDDHESSSGTSAESRRVVEPSSGHTPEPSALTPPAPGLPAALRAMPSLENPPSPSLSWDRPEQHGRDTGPATTSSPTAWMPPTSSHTAPTVAPPSAMAASLVASSFIAPSAPAAPSSHAPTTAPLSAGARPASAREPLALPEVFTADDAARIVARAIAMRASGALALRTDVGTRHVLLHEGDLVTAASSSPDETLAAFLVERGDLGRSTLARIGARVPASGRLAGAALIANGYLAQDDLWPVLRAHAEWIVARALVAGPGSCQLEAEPAGRLKSEPGVFGGAAGAEVFVEIVRRTIPPAVAVARLGGPATRFDVGPRASLLAECALSREDEAAVRTLAGRSLGDVVEREGEDLASVVLALCELEVLSALAAPRRTAGEEAPKDDPLDDEAVRARVQARLALVREGDYFSVLGVARDATAYEIKRAYLDLRRTFEPTRLLTARTIDLADDVRLLLEVADEAYDILKDATRRERYRRAIEVAPPE